MNPKDFFAELKRRNVYKVAFAYGVIAWLLIQAGSILFPIFEAPSWVLKVFVAIVFLGFPVALGDPSRGPGDFFYRPQAAKRLQGSLHHENHYPFLACSFSCRSSRRERTTAEPRA
jgi:hypothetical protein